MKGCGQFIVVAFLVLLALSALNNNSSTSSTATPSAAVVTPTALQTPTPVVGTWENPYLTGADVVVGQARWRVMRSEVKSKLSKSYGGQVAAKGKFIIVAVEVENLGKRPATVTDLDLVDGEGRQFTSVTESFKVTPPTIGFETLNPNMPFEYSTVFDIPTDATRLTVTVSDLAIIEPKLAHVLLSVEQGALLPTPLPQPTATASSARAEATPTPDGARHTIRGLTADRAVAHMTELGWRCSDPRQLGSQVKWTCKPPDAGPFDPSNSVVEILGKDPSRITFVNSVLMGPASSHINVGQAASFLADVAAGMSYDGAEPERARQWVKDQIPRVDTGVVADTSIGKARLEVFGPDTAKWLQITPIDGVPILD